MLDNLALENFRNFNKAKLSFTQRNIIIGANGSGKSTILEAVRLLSVGKSFRTSRLEEVIFFKKEFFRLGAMINNGETVELFYGKQFIESQEFTRHLNYNGSRTNWLEFFGVFPTVLFVPEDLEIVLGSPQNRRRYLDSVIWQVNPEFRHQSLELYRTLRERSALLFLLKIRQAGLDELKPWNEILSSLTRQIRVARERFVEYLNRWFSVKKIPVRVSLKYHYDQREINKFIDQEIRTGQNLYGPQRDDLTVGFKDFSARRFASRGQARLVTLFLKAAEADYLAEQTNRTVTVLLDDIISELDSRNFALGLEGFSSRHQLIITSVDRLKLGNDWAIIQLR